MDNTNNFGLNKDFFENRYFNTYYYANIVNNILSGDVELIGFVSNYFSQEEIKIYLARPFPKDNAFRNFIFFMIADFFENDMDEYDQRIFSYYEVTKYELEPLYAESALKAHELCDYSFKEFLEGKATIEYSDIEEYREELILTGQLEELYDKVADEVFYIMFNNRQALMEFNSMIAQHMDDDQEEIEDEETSNLFNEKGHLKRVHIPAWCKKAIYFRERGRCCLCGTDLTRTLNISSKSHYDHIVPLSKGGINDISNLQLLCSTCNLSKNKHTIQTSSYYEKWY